MVLQIIPISFYLVLASFFSVEKNKSIFIHFWTCTLCVTVHVTTRFWLYIYVYVICCFNPLCMLLVIPNYGLTYLLMVYSRCHHDSSFQVVFIYTVNMNHHHNKRVWFSHTTHTYKLLVQHRDTFSHCTDVVTILDVNVLKWYPFYQQYILMWNPIRIINIQNSHNHNES